MLKNSLRRQMLKLRRKHAKTAAKKAKDAKIFKTLANFAKFKKAEEFFTYLSHGSEVPTDALINNYFGKKKIIVPKMENGCICLHELADSSEFVKGAFGIREPRACLPKKEMKSIEVALVPAVAFDESGHRIGYGGGHFDRLLSKLRCTTIGLAYEFQIIDKVPVHPYDVPVDYIITEKKVIDCAKHKPNNYGNGCNCSHF